MNLHMDMGVQRSEELVMFDIQSRYSLGMGLVIC